RYPQSDIAMYALYRSAVSQKDQQQMIRMFINFVNTDYERSYINKIYTENALKKLFYYYAEYGSPKMMKKYLNRYFNVVSTKPITSKYYKEIAHVLVEETDEYKLALNYIQKAL